MALDDSISSLIGDIYLAAHDHVCLPQVAAKLLQVVGGRTLMIASLDLRAGDFPQSHFFGMDDSSLADAASEYADHMYAQDPTVTFTRSRPKDGLFSSRQHVRPDDNAGQAYLQWHQDRFNSSGWLLMYAPVTDGLVFGASLHSRFGEAPDDPARVKLFRMFYGHLENATRLAARPLQCDPTDDGRATILVDGFGRVRHVSAAAATLLAAGDGISISGIRLAVSRAHDQSRIDTALRTALSALTEGSNGADLVLERPSGKRPYLLSVRANPRPRTPFDMYRPSAVITIVDPEQLGARPASERWRALFGLTRTEAMLADALLAPDADVADAADALGMARATARVHLRNIFRKVGVHRQTDLVRLLMRLG